MTDEPKVGVYRRNPGSDTAETYLDGDEMERARDIVSAAHPPTPLIRSQALSAAVDREVFLKLESLSAVRSFKYRGALVAVARAAEEAPGRCIVTASTGNHGQGIAFAGRRYGLRVIVCSPESTLAEKRAAMEELGATVVISGQTLTDAERKAQTIASEQNALYIEDGESPHLMAGATTLVTEMLEQQPDLDTIVVPVGGGNLIAASLLAAQAGDGRVTIIGTQSGRAPGATLSWLAGRIVRHGCDTYAGGLATERPGKLALSVMSRLATTMILVDDDHLRERSGFAFRSLGLVVEGAAAAPLAALHLYPDAIPGERIGLVISGSWLSATQLSEALAHGERGQLDS